MLAIRLVAISFLAMALAIGCDSHREPPNILLIVVDTLRADRVDAYGNTRGLTPFLDELAARGTVFRNAYAASSWTNPSIASLFTSRYPSQNHVATFESKLSEAEVTLAEKLEASHYWTVGYSANFRLTTALGFGQGFGNWVALATKVKKLPLEFIFTFFDRNCPTSATRPCMLYLQYLDPHAPYEPPEPFRHRFQRSGTSSEAAEEVNRKLQSKGELTPEEIELLASLYDGEVAFVDEQIRTLFGELERRRFLDDAIIVITADHGEEFNEHGLMGHGRSLYNETVRVPLIIVAPGYAGGHVVEDNVSLVDVAPTLLHLAGIPAEARFEGRSLVPLMRGTLLTRLAASLKGSTSPTTAPNAGGAGSTAAADVILQLEPGGGQFDRRRHTEGLVRQSAKLLSNPDGGLEVYDLAADPAEVHPNPVDLTSRQGELIAALHARQAELGTRVHPVAEHGPVDEATREKLRALGYRDF